MAHSLQHADTDIDQHRSRSCGRYDKGHRGKKQSQKKAYTRKHHGQSRLSSGLYTRRGFQISSHARHSKKCSQTRCSRIYLKTLIDL